MNVRQQRGSETRIGSTTEDRIEPAGCDEPIPDVDCQGAGHAADSSDAGAMKVVPHRE